MENNFNLKKFLAEGKMLKESISSDVEEYLIGLYDQFASEDYEEGEEISNLISREEYGDPEPILETIFKPVFCNKLKFLINFHLGHGQTLHY